MEDSRRRGEPAQQLREGQRERVVRAAQRDLLGPLGRGRHQRLAHRRRVQCGRRRGGGLAEGHVGDPRCFWRWRSTSRVGGGALRRELLTEGGESPAAPGRAAPAVSVLVWCRRTTLRQHSAASVLTFGGQEPHKPASSGVAHPGRRTTAPGRAASGPLPLGDAVSAAQRRERRADDNTKRAAPTSRPPRTKNAGASTQPLRDDRDDEDGHDVGHLDHRVDRGAGGVLERVADGVAGDRRRRGPRSPCRRRRRPR